MTDWRSIRRAIQTFRILDELLHEPFGDLMKNRIYITICFLTRKARAGGAGASFQTALHDSLFELFGPIV